MPSDVEFGRMNIDNSVSRAKRPIVVASRIPSKRMLSVGFPNRSGGVLAVLSRNTKQKDAIRTAFESEGRPLSPEETLNYAQEQVEGISIATVYRNISSLVEERWLTPIDLPGESTRYVVAGKDQHHHFRCNSCGKVFEMPALVSSARPKLPRGFRATGHEFFIYGVCSDCK